MVVLYRDKVGRHREEQIHGSGIDTASSSPAIPKTDTFLIFSSICVIYGNSNLMKNIFIVVLGYLI